MDIDPEAWFNVYGYSVKILSKKGQIKPFFFLLLSMQINEL